MYNLYVEDNHDFSSCGIILHNCDAMRYVCNTVIKAKTRLYGILLS